MTKVCWSSLTTAAIIARAPLDALLAQASGTVNISAIPGGSSTATFDRGVYYAEAWVWNSSDPTGTFTRQPAGALVDLRATNARHAHSNHQLRALGPARLAKRASLKAKALLSSR